MKTTAQRKAPPPIDVPAEKAQSKPPFNIVIAYDASASGRHAVETSHRLIADFRKNFNVRVKMWSFGLLRNTAASLTAATDAAKAQMVVIATSSRDLPPAVKKWIEAWLVWKGGRRGMLVALLKNTDSSFNSFPAENYLRMVAATGGLEFLLQNISRAEERGMFWPQ